MVFVLWQINDGLRPMDYQDVPVLTPKEQQHIIKETQCLHEALWFESASEPLKGKVAVLEVIHNRTLHKNYPDSYCGVIQQSRQFSYRNHLKKGQTMLIKTPLNAIERLWHSTQLRAV